jgi:hypothetical protein
VAHSLRFLRPTFHIRSSFPHVFCTLFPIHRQNYVTTGGRSWYLAQSGAQGQIFVPVRRLRVCLCGAPCPTRERICRLQLELALTSAVICGPYHRFETPRIYIPQEQGGGAQLYRQAGVPLSLPATRRATMEVFGLASTRAYLSHLILPVLTTRALEMCDFLHFRS